MLVDLPTFSKTKMKNVYGDDNENDTDKGYGFCEINNEMRYDVQKDDSGDLAEASASAASMAGPDRLNDNLLKLPFSVTVDLMNTLDIDRGWEYVAGAAGMTFDQIQQLNLRSSQSPTRGLLWQLGSLNYTVGELYETLKSAKRFREMQTLEAYVKEGGMKGAKPKPTSPQPSLSSLLTQIKESGLKSQGRSGSTLSMSGSELNFNKPSPIDIAKVIQSKNYGDKIIPGPILPLKESNGNNIPRSISFDHQSVLPTAKVPYDRFKSLPPSYQQSPQQQAEGPRTDGVENIPLSANSFPTSSANKSTPSQSVASSSLNSDPKMVSCSSLPVDIAESKVSFSYRELLNATDAFHKSRILGEGGFGHVYRGTLNQQECAIKRLYTSTTDSQKSEQVKSELAALLKYRHENIVPLYGYAENASELCLVYQYMVNGSLEDRLLHKNDTPSLTWERRLNILIGSCRGLNFLHTMGEVPLIHGDIKSANILLDQYFEAKLGDFGQAKYATRSSSTDTSGFTHITVAETKTRLYGTRAYLAPELTTNGTQSVKSDIYALGVVFLEVCTGLKACDQNRSVGSFLVDYIRNEIDDKAENVSREQFQDRTMHVVRDDIFINVMKLALKCVSNAKKARPDTKKLLGEMKQMYEQNQGSNGNEGSISSISTSLQIDSRQTITYQLSNIESHLGGPAADYVCGPDHRTTIRPELLKLQPPLQKLPEQKSVVREPAELQQAILASFSSTVHTQSTAELRNHPVAENPPKNLPPNVPQTEAFLLQAAYDRQPGRKVIDRLSGLLQKGEQLPEEYPSDPEKLQKIDKFDMEQQNRMPSHFTVFQTGNQEQDSFPQADPKKLAQLKAYDEANFGTSGHSADDSACLDCDPAKLACLEKFDDNLYKPPAEKHGDSDTQQIAVTEAVQHSNNNNYLIKTCNLSDVQAWYQHNTTTCVPDNGQLYLPHLTSPVVIEDDGVGYASDERASQDSEKYLNFRYTNENNGIQWPRNGSDINGVCNKPGKQMINSLFAKYREEQNAAVVNDDDDDDGCSNEEVGANI
ncbi:hypothetical protein BsWGS_11104 [Bradybaena similaris]